MANLKDHAIDILCDLLFVGDDEKEAETKVCAFRVFKFCYLFCVGWLRLVAGVSFER